MNPGAIKIRNAVLSGSLVLALYGIIASVGLILVSSYLSHAADSINEAVDSIVVSEELQIDLLEHNREQLLFNYTGETIHAMRRDQAAIALDRGTKTIELYVNSDAEKVLVTEVQSLIRNYILMQQNTVEDQAAMQKYMAATAALDTITRHLRKLILLNQEQARNVKERVARQDMMADVLGFSIIAALLATLGILGWGTRSVIYRPLVSLREVVKRYSKGDFKARAELRGPQELREIAAVFNEMASNLENTHKDQHRFLSAIAHDLRNPIGAIKMSMDLIISTPAEDYHEIIDLAAIVHRQSDQLDQMVGDLLDRTRIEAGDLELKLEQHDLRESASQAVRLYQSTSANHSIRLHVPSEPVECLCDPTRIGQVLNNLLSNAVKYSPNGGTVGVDVKHGKDEVTITITDQGLGISAEDHERIFEPFQRSTSTREKIPGVGLGLSVSRRLIERHGGRIDVQSESGCGSSFTVKLPTSAIARPEDSARSQGLCERLGL